MHGMYHAHSAEEAYSAAQYALKMDAVRKQAEAQLAASREKAREKNDADNAGCSRNAVEDAAACEDESTAAEDIYTMYRPYRITEGCDHPDPVVETASLSNVVPPEVTYQHHLQEAVTKETLSSLQIESVCYAWQRFTGPRMRPAHEAAGPGARMGFFLGDGAGVGKGRQIAAVMHEFFRRGGRRALWVSVSTDLKWDAERDLNDLQLGEIQVYPKGTAPLPAGNLSSKANGITEGVLFVTYSLLVSSGSKGSRLDQLLTWLKAEDGEAPLIVLDECHKAKNLMPTNGKPTKTALEVVRLQSTLPNAYVMYCSATGASDPMSLAYMVRLGTFGYKDAKGLLTSVAQAGFGAQEVFAMGLKCMGAYLCRTLSYQGAEFNVVNCEVDPDFLIMFDRASAFWQLLFRTFKKAHLNGARMNKHSWAQFWGGHQRFFRQMLIAAKVPRLARLAAETVYRDNMCVVIGLQSTGEASTTQRMAENGEDQDDFVSAPAIILENMIKKQFPVMAEMGMQPADLEKLYDDVYKCVQVWQQKGRVAEATATAPPGGSQPNTQEGNAGDSDSDDGCEILAEKSPEDVQAEKWQEAAMTGNIIELDGSPPRSSSATAATRAGWSGGGGGSFGAAGGSGRYSSAGPGMASVGPNFVAGGGGVGSAGQGGGVGLGVQGASPEYIMGAVSGLNNRLVSLQKLIGLGGMNLTFGTATGGGGGGVPLGNQQQQGVGQQFQQLHSGFQQQGAQQRQFGATGQGNGQQQMMGGGVGAAGFQQHSSFQEQQQLAGSAHAGGMHQMVGVGGVSAAFQQQQQGGGQQQHQFGAQQQQVIGGGGGGGDTFLQHSGFRQQAQQQGGSQFQQAQQPGGSQFQQAQQPGGSQFQFQTGSGSMPQHFGGYQQQQQQLRLEQQQQQLRLEQQQQQLRLQQQWRQQQQQSNVHNHHPALAGADLVAQANAAAAARAAAAGPAMAMVGPSGPDAHAEGAAEFRERAKEKAAAVAGEAERAMSQRRADAQARFARQRAAVAAVEAAAAAAVGAGGNSQEDPMLLGGSEDEDDFEDDGKGKGKGRAAPKRGRAAATIDSDSEAEPSWEGEGCGGCGVDSDDLLLCDGCDAPWCLKCAGLDDVPEGNFHCKDCVAGKTPEKEKPRGSRRRPARAAARKRVCLAESSDEDLDDESEGGGGDDFSDDDFDEAGTPVKKGRAKRVRLAGGGGGGGSNGNAPSASGGGGNGSRRAALQALASRVKTEGGASGAGASGAPAKRVKREGGRTTRQNRDEDEDFQVLSGSEYDDGDDDEDGDDSDGSGGSGSSGARGGRPWIGDEELAHETDKNGTQYRRCDRLVAVRDLLLRAVEMLELPPNPLDHLTDLLGGPKKVAEMTGRTGHLCRGENGQISFKRRRPEVSNKLINMTERDDFMKGKKLFAIISEAASCGISLQADKRARNTRRRVHFTLELPWSAEKAIQQFGRSHRSNQVSAPIYRILVTPVGGERRFASSAAKRLSQLGAILQGDRRALGAGTDLKAFDVDNKYGTQALKTMCSQVMERREPLAGVDLPRVWLKEDDPTGARECCIRYHDRDPATRGPRPNDKSSSCPKCFSIYCARNLGAVGFGEHRSKGGQESWKVEKKGDIRVDRFLNRLLGLPIRDQQVLFHCFSQTYDAVVTHEKSKGSWDSGIVELRGSSIRVEPDYPETLHTCPDSCAETHLVKLDLDRGLSFDAAVKELDEFLASSRERGEEPSPNNGFWLGTYTNDFQGSGRPLVNMVTAISTGQRSRAGREDPPTKQFRKRAPQNYNAPSENLRHLTANYKKVSPEEARATWDFWYERTGAGCMHGPRCKTAEKSGSCSYGSRHHPVHLVTGAVLPVWKALDRECAFFKQNIETGSAERKSGLRVVKAAADDGKRFVGLSLDSDQVAKVVPVLRELNEAAQRGEGEQALLELPDDGSALPVDPGGAGSAFGMQVYGDVLQNQWGM